MTGAWGCLKCNIIFVRSKWALISVTMWHFLFVVQGWELMFIYRICSCACKHKNYALNKPCCCWKMSTYACLKGISMSFCPVTVITQDNWTLLSALLKDPHNSLGILNVAQVTGQMACFGSCWLKLWRGMAPVYSIMRPFLLYTHTSKTFNWLRRIARHGRDSTDFGTHVKHCFPAN